MTDVLLAGLVAYVAGAAWLVLALCRAAARGDRYEDGP